MGFAVDSATDGNDAWEIFCRGAYHSVLVDFRLPGISGEDLFSRIKKIAPDVDVVLLTGNTSVDKIMTLVDRGVTDYLIKPANPIRIREMFEKIATKQKLFNDGSTLADELGELPDISLTNGDEVPSFDSSPSMTPMQDFNEVHVDDFVIESSVESDNAHVSHVPEEVQRLSGEVHELSRELQRIQSMVGDLTSERDMLRHESDRLRTEHQVSQNDNVEFSSKIDVLESKNVELAQTVERLTNKVERQAEDLHSLEAQLDGSTRELADINLSRERLKTALEREREGARRQNIRVDELAKNLEAEKEKTISSSAAGDLIADLREEISALSSTATAREEAITYLKRQLKARTEKYKVLKEAAKELQVDHASIEALSRDSESKIREMKRTLENRASRIEQLEEQVTRSKNRVTALTSELDQRDSEILQVRTEALQSGEEVVLNTELRYKRIVEGLNNDIENLKSDIDEKDLKLSETRELLYEQKEQMAISKDEFSNEKNELLRELAELREVLSEREQIVRDTKIERENEFQQKLASKELALEEARQSGQQETERLEEELEALRQTQKKGALQDELQSEWMELGEALVLLDEELKEKEAEVRDLKEEFAKRERAYETTIANQKRKYSDLEIKIFEQIEEGKRSSSDSSSEGNHVESGIEAKAVDVSLLSHLEGLSGGTVLLSADGRTLDFNEEFQTCFAIDSTRRTSSSSFFEVSSSKYIQPLFLRLVQGEDEMIERPLYIRAKGSEPKPYWGVASTVDQDGEKAFSIELFDLSGLPDLFAMVDFTDARIAFELFDSICAVSTKMTEALFSVRIVVEILQKKFKSDVELHSMISDVLEELNGLMKLVSGI
jgi:YesN/AraC family two-component response regulator